MANAFTKPAVIMTTILGMLQPELVLPNYVWKDGLGDFAGKYNDTITIRIPQPTIAHTRQLRATGAARNLTSSDLTEITVDVKLTDVVYNLVLLTDEERELDVRSFGVDVLPRQVRAVSEKLEYGLADTIYNAPYSAVNVSDLDDMWSTTISARRKLNDAFVPRDNRVLIIGSAVEEALLNDDRFIRYDSAGEVGASRLQTARIGRFANHETILVDTIPHGSAFLYHPTAFVLVTRPPGAPFSNTVAVARTASENGIGLRWLGDYDSQATTDRSLIDTWVGYKAISDPDPGFVRAQRIQLKATSSGTAIGNQGTVTASAGANKTRQLTLVDDHSDDRAADPFVVWASSDATKATVSATGKVTGVAAGSTNITATLPDGFTKTWALTVAS